MGNKIGANLRTYFKKQKQDAILHTITGFGISALLLETIHLGTFIKENNVIGLSILFVISITPLTIDFLFFVLRNSSPIHEKLYKHNEAALSLLKENNVYRIKSAMTRIERETTYFKQINDNNFVLPALQNYEYIRDVVGKVIKDVMAPGDKYVTLSNLEFWTKTPRQNNFFKLNVYAHENQHKSIDRVIVLDKKLKISNPNDEIIIRKQNQLKNLLQEFSVKKHESNYYSEMKTLFYFPEDYDSIKEFLLSLIIISSDFKNLLFIKIDDWEELELVNPKIKINFFTLTNFHVNPEEIKDIPKIISLLFNYIGNEIKNSGDKVYTDLYTYLRAYKECFGRLHNIYGENGAPIKTISLDRCDLFDLKMLLEYFQLKV